MKKLTSLLLALALVLGLTCGMALAADPVEVDKAAAGVLYVDEAGTEHYYETLSSGLISLAVKDAANPTLTVLKDLDLSSNTASAVMQTPTAGSQWKGGNGAQDRLTIDLDGHTLSYTGTGALFNGYRWGGTIKNGTILYTNTSAGGGSPIMLSTPTYRTALTSGSSVWNSKVRLLNLDVYNLSEGGGAVVASYVHSATVSVYNCTLYSAKGPAILMGKTDQSDIGETGKPWTGAYDPTLALSSSEIISGSTYPIQYTETGVTASSMECAFVSNAADGKPAAAAPAVTMDMGGQAPEPQNNWSTKLSNGVTVSGKATVYGAAALPELTADTAQSLYDQGIISAVVLALMTQK